jgi:hypothetical protein
LESPRYNFSYSRYMAGRYGLANALFFFGS